MTDPTLPANYSAADMDGVPCWPEGSATRYPCDAHIPNTDYETMERFGWGWVLAPDAGSPDGTGMFYACPEHRDDCTEEEREIARRLYATATGGDNGR